MPVKGEARLAQRLRVLEVWAANPDWLPTRIGRELGGVPESTVRGIINKYGPDYKPLEVAAAPQDAPRSGRPAVRSIRWKRCVCVLFLVVFKKLLLCRHLAQICQKHPFWTLRRLAVEMEKWERESALERPAGAVITIPKRACHMTIKRFAQDFVLQHNFNPIAPLPYRYLHHMGIDNYRAAKVPALSKKNIRDRFKFAKDMMNYDWSKV